MDRSQALLCFIGALMNKLGVKYVSLTRDELETFNIENNLVVSSTFGSIEISVMNDLEFDLFQQSVEQHKAKIMPWPVSKGNA